LETTCFATINYGKAAFAIQPGGCLLVSGLTSTGIAAHALLPKEVALVATTGIFTILALVPS